MVNVGVTGSEVSVTGDFFIEPAEAREEIESILKESRNLSEDKMIEKVSDIDARLIGFSAEDVVEAFRKAVGDQE